MTYSNIHTNKYNNLYKMMWYDAMEMEYRVSTHTYIIPFVRLWLFLYSFLSCFIEMVYTKEKTMLVIKCVLCHLVQERFCSIRLEYYRNILRYIRSSDDDTQCYPLSWIEGLLYVYNVRDMQILELGCYVSRGKLFIIAL